MEIIKIIKSQKYYVSSRTNLELPLAECWHFLGRIDAVFQWWVVYRLKCSTSIPVEDNEISPSVHFLLTVGIGCCDYYGTRPENGHMAIRTLWVQASTSKGKIVTISDIHRTMVRIKSSCSTLSMQLKYSTVQYSIGISWAHSDRWLSYYEKLTEFGCKPCANCWTAAAAAAAAFMEEEADEEAVEGAGLADVIPAMPPPPPAPLELSSLS